MTSRLQGMCSTAALQPQPASFEHSICHGTGFLEGQKYSKARNKNGLFLDLLCDPIRPGHPIGSKLSPLELSPCSSKESFVVVSLWKLGKDRNQNGNCSFRELSKKGFVINDKEVPLLECRGKILKIINTLIWSYSY